PARKELSAVQAGAFTSPPPPPTSSQTTRSPAALSRRYSSRTPNTVPRFQHHDKRARPGETSPAGSPMKVDSPNPPSLGSPPAQDFERSPSAEQRSTSSTPSSPQLPTTSQLPTSSPPIDSPPPQRDPSATPAPTSSAPPPPTPQFEPAGRTQRNRRAPVLPDASPDMDRPMRCSKGSHSKPRRDFMVLGRMVTRCKACRDADQKQKENEAAKVQQWRDMEERAQQEEDERQAAEAAGFHPNSTPLPDVNEDKEEENLDDLSDFQRGLRESAISDRDRVLLENFQRKMGEEKMEECSVCEERWFGMGLNSKRKEGELGECARCRKDKKDVKKFSKENNMSFGLSCLELDPSLAAFGPLTQIEEMLLSPLQVMQQIWTFYGGQTKYTGHCVNFIRNNSHFLKRIPALPEDVDVIIIRKRGADPETAKSSFQEFNVNRARMTAYIRFFQKHHPTFRNNPELIDEDALANLPENGNIYKQLKSVETVEDDLDGAGLDVGPVEGEDEEDGDGLVGAFQVVSNGLVPNITDDDLEVDRIRRDLQGALDDDEVILTMPSARQTPLNEHEGREFIRDAFPFLFPTGVGDLNAYRTHAVTDQDWFKHVMKARDGRFAQHPRFRYYILNMCLRWQAKKISKYYCKRHKADKVMTLSELRALLKGPATRLADRISRSADPIKGTRPYWMKKRSQLESMIVAHDTPHVFITLSSADLQWADLHGHMPPPPHLPDVETEHTKYRHRNYSLNNNPHIAAWYFQRRWEVYFKEFLTPKLGVVDHWYRYEWQHRGSSHVHGFLWLADAPDLSNLELALKPFIKAKTSKTVAFDSEGEFGQAAMALVPEVAAYVKYWDGIISTHSPALCHEIPPARIHPSAREWNSLRHNLLELGELLNRVERHTKCQRGYCVRKKRNIAEDEPTPAQPGLERGEYCRFGYPKEVLDATELIIDTKGIIELLTRRNDPLLNPHNPAQILSWQANVDFKPVVSKSSVIAYIAKYVSKAEPKSIPYISILQDVLADTRISDTAAIVRVVAQKMLNKFIVERDYSAQECCHLLLECPLVGCSRTFAPLNLGKVSSFFRFYSLKVTYKFREQIRSGGVPEVGPDVEDADEREGIGTPVGLPDDALLDGGLEKYEKRPLGDADNISLLEIYRCYKWSPKTGYVRRPKAPPKVVQVYPAYSADPRDDEYEDYCRAKLQLHHSYRGDPSVLQKDEDGLDIGFEEAYRRCQATCGPSHPRDNLPVLQTEDPDSDDEAEDSGDDVEADNRIQHQNDAQRLAAQGVAPVAGLGRARLRLGLKDPDYAQNWLAKHALFPGMDIIQVYIDSEKKLSGDSDDRELDEVDITLLCGEQKRLFSKVVAHVDAHIRGVTVPPIRVHVDGTAGTGKSFVITAISTALREAAVRAPHDEEGKPQAFILRLAPSGIAAYNIKGETIHSGLKIPVTKGKDYLPLPAAQLAKLQTRFQHLRYIIVDEKSMVGQRLFGRLSLRLQEIKACKEPFGGLSVLLFGDFGQLPPVADLALFDENADRGELALAGRVAYESITESITLRRLMRQQGEDPESIAFKKALTNLREQTVTQEDYELLAARTFEKLPPAEVSTFDDAIRLLTKNDEVELFNEYALQEAGRPVLRVYADHKGGVYADHKGGSVAEEAEANDAGGLEASLFLMEGAKVMLTTNLWTAKGLTNCVKGTIEHIIYAEGAKDPRNLPGIGKKANLPLAVLLHIPGYTGPTRWHREDGEPLVPISPTLARWEGKNGIQCSRRQLPLKIAYGVTVHKSQGLTLDRVVIHLGKNEFQRGLAFVACSRVRNLKDLAFAEYIPPARLLDLGKSKKGANGVRIEGPWERDVARREVMGFADDDYGSEVRYRFAEDEK
ncbi:ATP-dependent DNA helicase PIF1, partial [Phenoliferia sp. Uapishka_3]